MHFRGCLHEVEELPARACIGRPCSDVYLIRSKLPRALGCPRRNFALGLRILWRGRHFFILFRLSPTTSHTPPPTEPPPGLLHLLHNAGQRTKSAGGASVPSPDFATGFCPGSQQNKQSGRRRKQALIALQTQTQFRGYAVTAPDEKVAKFLGQKGSDVRAATINLRLSHAKAYR